MIPNWQTSFWYTNSNQILMTAEGSYSILMTVQILYFSNVMPWHDESGQMTIYQPHIDSRAKPEILLWTMDGLRNLAILFKTVTGSELKPVDGHGWFQILGFLAQIASTFCHVEGRCENLILNCLIGQLSGQLGFPEGKLMMKPQTRWLLLISVFV